MSLLRVYKSCGLRPVRFAIRASIRGPISSLAWNANTKFGYPDFISVLCDEDMRFISHPLRNNAARTRFDFELGHWLMLLQM